MLFEYPIRKGMPRDLLSTNYICIVRLTAMKQLRKRPKIPAYIAAVIIA
jgi:hypothetical protein